MLYEGFVQAPAFSLKEIVTADLYRFNQFSTEFPQHVLYLGADTCPLEPRPSLRCLSIDIGDSECVSCMVSKQISGTIVPHRIETEAMASVNTFMIFQIDSICFFKLKKKELIGLKAMNF